MNIETTSIGKYYLGDPSVLHDKYLHGIWGDIYNYENGNHIINSYDFIVHSTHNGDGVFYDIKNRKYTVNSGVIALIDINLIDDINLCKKYGHIFNFEKKVNFIYDAGLFYIIYDKKTIKIDTRNINEYDSEFEEHCENDKGIYISKTINDSDNESIDSVRSNNNSNELEEVEEELEEIHTKFNFFKKKNI
jgi:hypothetical protein